MKEKTKRKVWIALAALTLLLTIIGATYAYFIVSEGTTLTSEVGAQTAQVDSLRFSINKDINVHTRQEDFIQGAGNVSDDATGTATLLAGSGEEPRYTYNVFISVYENTFIYTTEDHQIELLLKVTGPGGEVTSIEGLTYNTELHGFDITTKKGIIPISLDQEITTTTEKIENWKVEVVLVNLDSDQTLNASKKFEAELKLQQKMKISDICISREFAKCIIENYILDSSIIYHDIGEAKQGTILIDNVNLSAEDKSYRYSGKSTEVDNYVCLGSTEIPCPENNLYRIIGVFPADQTNEEYQIKLIKNSSIGMYYWSGSSSSSTTNNWTDSALRTDILNNINGEYWQSLSLDSSKVADHNWVISGGSRENIERANAQITYKYEVAKLCDACSEKQPYTTIINKVGLMYVSDYMYATNPSGWNVTGDNYSSNKANNWLHLSNSGNNDNHEWTISRVSENKTWNYYIYNNENIGYGIGSSSKLAVRPSIYLNSSVELSSGTGTDTDPYRIK